MCLRRLTFSQLSGKSRSLSVYVQIPRAWYFGSEPWECQEFGRQLLTRVNWFGYERWLSLAAEDAVGDVQRWKWKRWYEKIGQGMCDECEGA